MSALGQKQTFAVHQPMSALLPIATAKADIYAAKRHVRYSPESGHVRCAMLVRMLDRRDIQADCNPFSITANNHEIECFVGDVCPRWPKVAIPFKPVCVRFWALSRPNETLCVENFLEQGSDRQRRCLQARKAIVLSDLAGTAKMFESLSQQAIWIVEMFVEWPWRELTLLRSANSVSRRRSVGGSL
jgi:hypothetical protein